MNLSTIIANRVALFTAGNNAGDGFDPAAMLTGGRPTHRADTTDDVSVYVIGDEAILVGTDGTGDDDSRWAVVVELDKISMEECLSYLAARGCEAHDNGDGRILVTSWPGDTYSAPRGWTDDGADDIGEYLVGPSAEDGE